MTTTAKTLTAQIIAGLDQAKPGWRTYYVNVHAAIRGTGNPSLTALYSEWLATPAGARYLACKDKWEKLGAEERAERERRLDQEHGRPESVEEIDLFDLQHRGAAALLDEAEWTDSVYGLEGEYEAS